MFGKMEKSTQWKHTKRNGEGANFYIDGSIFQREICK